jgi:hypothetical protein
MVPCVTYLLSGGIPHIEFHGTTIGMKGQWMDFNTQGSDVLLFKFTRQMTFDKGRLTDPTITDQNEFEFWNLFRLLYDMWWLLLLL